MLVLSRKPTEKIVIGNDIVITVVKVQGKSVRLGIEAPQDVRVLRGELPRFDDESNDVHITSDISLSQCNSRRNIESTRSQSNSLTRMRDDGSSDSCEATRRAESRCPSNASCAEPHHSVRQSCADHAIESGWSVSSMKRRVQLATMKLNQTDVS